MPLIIILAVLWLLSQLLTFPAATEKELVRLERVFQLRVRLWLFLVKLIHRLDVLITDGVRTPAEQNAQHAKNPKNPAYDPKNPGSHILGKAVDVNFKRAGVLVLVKASSASAWAPVVILAKICGLSWGGDFKTYSDDRVHFYAS